MPGRKKAAGAGKEGGLWRPTPGSFRAGLKRAHDGETREDVFRKHLKRLSEEAKKGEST